RERVVMKVTIYVANYMGIYVLEGEREVSSLDQAMSIGMRWIDELNTEAGPYELEIHPHPERSE
ncbi:MAG: hypothetical protein RBR68_15815, partial [Tenuifilaceae bacterium]|nr:hypothetical protein [Tenuifilaceae bacterium]